MARPTLGGIGLYLLDLKGRRRAAAALRRAMPELEGGEIPRLVRVAYARERQRRRYDRRAGRRSDVELCGSLRFEGWENIHNSQDRPLFLLAPLGSTAVAARVVELYREGSRAAAVLPPAAGEDAALEAAFFRRGIRCSARPARLALEEGLAAIWTLALPEPRGRWAVHFLPPVPTRPAETEVALTERYLSALEGMIRQHPEDWPWHRLG